MPELHFKGKEFVFNHHLTVPYRPLVADAAKSVGPADMAGNLIIHGDNLEALKALLPVYAGKVDCIFIDPPYNTGNEGWAYNDAVNSPMMREWLRKVVDRDDLLRHDKWLCMMWPRLRLLHELLSERGSLWMTLDDNEVHHALAALDEIFGEQNHEVTIAWEKRYTRSNNATRFSSSKDYVIVYRKSDLFRPNKERRSEESEESYTNPDNDPNGPWISVSYVNPALKADRPNLVYKIKNPFTGEEVEHETNAWKFSPETHQEHVAENRLFWGANGEFRYPRLKVYLKDGVVPIDLWSHEFAGTTDQAFTELERIMGRGKIETIKPVRLIERVLEIAAGPDALVLDSFAGSGTTAHAVLAANKRDGGTRRFILVEGEDYADTLTAERVRRVINGYEFQGTQREELLRESVTYTTLKRASAVLDRIAAIENLNRHRFDDIKKQVKDGVLTVVGEKKVTERTEGLPGGFTFCTLGPPLDLDSLLADGAMPAFSALGGWLFHTATGTALDPAKLEEASGFLGEGGGWAVSMLYRPDRAWLESPDAALTLDRAKAIAAARPGARHLVFAAVSYVPSRTLEGLGITHVPLPFALFRVEQGS